MQGMHNHLEIYSLSSQGLIEDHGRVNNVAADNHNIYQDWILLDKQSKIVVFINPRLVKDIKAPKTTDLEHPNRTNDDYIAKAHMMQPFQLSLQEWKPGLSFVALLG
jgi:hypothetical protein